MSTPSSQALTTSKRKSSDSNNDNDKTLMPPPSYPPTKRIKRPNTVLDEDIYTDALSEIIARDFFPGLLEAKVKQEYLDALESKDREWISVARRRLGEVVLGGGDAGGKGKGRGRSGSVSKLIGKGGRRDVRQQQQQQQQQQIDQTPTSYGGHTPMSTVTPTPASTATASTSPDSAATTTKKEVPDISNLGLVSFQAKYTSEDNESFNKLVDKQNAKHREKYAWLWSGNKIPSARQLAHQRKEAKRITAQGGNPDVEQKGRQQKQSQQQLIKSDLDARPAQPDTWRSLPENPLMFIPSSVEETHETVQQRAEALSRAGPKRVVYQNTRLSSQDSQGQGQGQSVPPSPSISAIKDAIAGKPRPTESEAVTAGDTPRVNGYSFVDDEEPYPYNNNNNADTDTENEITDLHLLGKADTTPNPFQLRDTRKREDLHHRMVDRVARTRRAEKASREIKTPVPRFPSSPMLLDFGLRSQQQTPFGRSGGGYSSSSSSSKALTPAAQKLLQKVGGSSTPRSSSSRVGSFSSSRDMWTPTSKKLK